LFIPLAVIFTRKKAVKRMKLIVSYCFIALFLNVAAMFISQFHELLPAYLQENLVLYNLHSLIRVVFLGWYILTSMYTGFNTRWRVLLFVYCLGVAANFIFLQSPFEFSTRLFASESVILLLFCLSYFYSAMQDESETDWIKLPSFLVCIGISFFEAINFFIFLFFHPLAVKNEKFGRATWSIYNITFVLLCICLALAFKRNARVQQKKLGQI